jgi:tetratricopeptide (TPR) repeat protein
MRKRCRYLKAMRMPQLWWQLVFSIVLGCACPGWVQAREPVKPKSLHPEAQTLIDRAWAATDRDLEIPALDTALKHLEPAAALDPENDALRVELASDYFLRGLQMPAGSDAEIRSRNRYFEKGYAAAQKAISLRPSAGAHAYAAVNLGASKQYANLMSQAAILPELKSHLDWITKNEPTYQYGLAARFWSEFLTKAPDIILNMLGQDPEEIYENLQQAITAEPRFLDNYFCLAELYYSMKRKSEALDLLARVLQAPPDVFPQERGSNRLTQKKARARWKEWTQKEYPER